MAEKYDVSNPHPGLGVDDNIGNEYGHTHYPKIVYPNGVSVHPTGNAPVEGVIVNSKEEEDEAMKDVVVPEKLAPKTKGWNTK